MNEIFKTDFLTELNYSRIFIGIILLFLTTYAVSKTYKEYAYSYDNKVLFSQNLFPFVLSIFIIVSVIKSSIALSLGLVGALSIIRFRTAIKEPGQLITLLVLTGISISFAAEKEVLGIILGTLFMVHTISTKKLKQSQKSKNLEQQLILRIRLKKEAKTNIDLIEFDYFLRMYTDVNRNLIIEYKAKDKEVLMSTLSRIKEKNLIDEFEIF